jgi:metal-responsive CopG/Arc/MetJ family transcriptional regulator
MNGVILFLMKTAISLPNPLFEAADEFAKRLGVSRSVLYATAIEEYLRVHRDEAVTEALNRVYGTEDSSLDRGLVALQAAALPRDDW